MPFDLQRQAAKSLFRLAESCGAADRASTDELAPQDPQVWAAGQWPNEHALHDFCDRHVAAAHPLGQPHGSCMHGEGRGVMNIVLRACPLRPAASPPFPLRQTMLGAHMVNNPMSSDVTFIVEGRPFLAHKVQLLNSSEIFRTMFDGHYREKVRGCCAGPPAAALFLAAVMGWPGSVWRRVCLWVLHSGSQGLMLPAAPRLAGRGHHPHPQCPLGGVGEDDVLLLHRWGSRTVCDCGQAGAGELGASMFLHAEKVWGEAASMVQHERA